MNLIMNIYYHKLLGLSIGKMKQCLKTRKYMGKKQDKKRHIPSKKNPDKAACGVELEWDHLTYNPKRKDRVRDMIANRVCWKCIVWSGTEDRNEW